jgi:hypothetical protein
MALPRDFRDEVETELRATRRALAADRDRISALEELRRVVLALETLLARPITVIDVINSAPNAAERERRTSLVTVLRSG